MSADSALMSRTQHYAIDVPNAMWFYIGWNQVWDGKPTMFADKRVRQAMTMLIDRQAIVKDIMRGYATVNTSCFSPLSPQADPSISPWPYDPAKAMDLLAQAGYHQQNGTLIGPDAQPVKFPLSYKVTDPVRVRIASFVKDQLARAGIDVQLKPGELSVLVEQLKQRKIQVYLGAWSGVLEQDPHQILTTDAIKGTGDNFVAYSNPALDQLVDKARTLVKDDERMEEWHKAHQIIHEDQPYTFLFIQKSLAFVDGRFKGAVPTKTGVSSYEEWYVPTAAQKYKQ
jgi:peptide/nickel transport system substrate-binding protein